MLWKKARPSDNVNDTRQGKDARKHTGKLFGAGLAAIALTGAVLHSTLNSTPDEDQQLKFVQSVLGETEDTWTKLFAQTGRHYSPPTLVVFDNHMTSECGPASAPFYCPSNQQVYLDLALFTNLEQRFSVVADFARAYIIAHEIGHHVQLELGLSEPFEQALRDQKPVMGDGGLEVRAELQADCLAGVWAHHAQQRLDWLEPGDVEAALQAATVFGDDNLQSQASGQVRPETFAHGTSAQRVKWFKSGFDTGRIEACDTFNTSNLQELPQAAIF